jgi:hypothetical protein
MLVTMAVLAALTALRPSFNPYLINGAYIK